MHGLWQVLKILLWEWGGFWWSLHSTPLNPTCCWLLVEGSCQAWQTASLHFEKRPAKVVMRFTQSIVFICLFPIWLSTVTRIYKGMFFLRILPFPSVDLASLLLLLRHRPAATIYCTTFIAAATATTTTTTPRLLLRFLRRLLHYSRDAATTTTTCLRYYTLLHFAVLAA